MAEDFMLLCKIVVPVQLELEYLGPDVAYQVQVYRTGYRKNDAYSAYIDMGRPKDLPASQTGELPPLTRDLSETTQIMRASKARTLELDLKMNSIGGVGDLADRKIEIARIPIPRQ